MYTYVGVFSYFSNNNIRKGRGGTDIGVKLLLVMLVFQDTYTVQDVE